MKVVSPQAVTHGENVVILKKESDADRYNRQPSSCPGIARRY